MCIHNYVEIHVDTGRQPWISILRSCLPQSFEAWSVTRIGSVLIGQGLVVSYLRDSPISLLSDQAANLHLDIQLLTQATWILMLTQKILYQTTPLS